MTDHPHQPFELAPLLREQLLEHLAFLYGEERGQRTLVRLERILEQHVRKRAVAALPHRPALSERLTQGDALLITYGDQVQEPGVAPLRTLAEFLERHLTGLISGVHILPFYPSTSDDGFSVVDYTQVDPALGTWDDVEQIGRHFRLMFDAVINHISASSAWFQGFLRDEAPYTDYFIVVDPATDLSLVTRPRALPLLTPFETPSGTKYVWTTFSADQIDLNYANPEVLLAIIEVLLTYVEHDAEFIRLDAIAYLWKEIGTRCIHLPQTHRVVQLVRSVLDAVASEVLLITETNVPHQDNISYFGDGMNEAQLVYQFPLAPLVLNAFATGSARHLTRWAAGLEPGSEGTTFFNFLASHDGIGVMPALGILSQAEIDQLVERTLAHGGHASYKNNPDGTQSVYELNITFFDAISDPQADEPHSLKIDRFIASQAIMLALAGLPGIYVHSLVGSHNDHAGVAETGRYRSINRQKWQRAEIEARLSDPGSHEAQVLERYARLLRVHAGEPAFHPIAPQVIVEENDGLFVVARGEIGSQVLCVHNVSNTTQHLEIPATIWGASTTLLRDLVSGEKVELPTLVHEAASKLRLEVRPYQVLWLRAE